MVEEAPVVTPKPKCKTTRPKAVYLWTVNDVQKWLRRHCGDCYGLYNELFQRHEITGRALIRLRDNALTRLGIEDSNHREEICREIMKLKLKTDIMEIKDLEIRTNFSAYDLETLPL